MMQALMTTLRDLKLDGVRTGLQAMIDQGDSRIPDLAPVLARLLEAETVHRAELGTARRVKHARFRYEAGMQSVATGLDRNLDRDTVCRLAECRWIAQGQNILITGPTGAGKSYLASALGRQACQLGYHTLYFHCNRLWAMLGQARKRDAYGRELQKLAKAELLVLDDFGLGKLDAMERLAFLEILEDRWGRASTIVASQRPFATWHEVLGEPTVADAICDRLFSHAEKVELKGESRRRKPVSP
jgi:DNA replication protein DnaC